MLFFFLSNNDNDDGSTDLYSNFTASTLTTFINWTMQQIKKYTYKYVTYYTIHLLLVALWLITIVVCVVCYLSK